MTEPERVEELEAVARYAFKACEIGLPFEKMLEIVRKDHKLITATVKAQDVRCPHCGAKMITWCDWCKKGT